MDFKKLSPVLLILAVALLFLSGCASDNDKEINSGHDA